MANSEAKASGLVEYEVTITELRTVAVSVFATSEEHAKRKVTDGDYRASDEEVLDQMLETVVDVRRVK